MRDLHTHTVFSDGENTPEEMVLAAIEKGLDTIGISDHSYTFYDEAPCMPKEKLAEYISEISRLKEKYKDKIKVLCGIEQDYYSDMEVTSDFDYVIGSVHYLLINGEYVCVDDTADVIKKVADKYFGGDVMKIAELYFDTVSDVVRKTHASIIGHLDILTKFPIYDTKCDRYKNAWKKACDILLKENIPFEINTGGITRGYKTEFYPSEEIREYISSKGGKFIYSSDSHQKSTLCALFD